MVSLSPVILFTYNRPEHVGRAVSSLLSNPEAAETDLIVYSDGARGDSDKAGVEASRRLAREISGFKTVTIVERERNMGLAANVIYGVTEVVNRYGRVIVVEDDLIVSPFFLRFMNDALDCYADEPRVGHIQACDFTGDKLLPDTFLIKFTGSWGWATWQRAWRLFNADGSALLSEMERRGLTREFDFNGAYPFTRMLRRQIAGITNSWAIRWNASLFLADVLSLNIGGATLVKNNGFDGSGTNCGDEDDLYDSNFATAPIRVNKILPIEENSEARHAFERYYRRTNSLLAKAKRRIRRLFK